MRRVKKEIDITSSESLSGRQERKRTICEVIDGFRTYKMPETALIPIDDIRNQVREFMVDELYDMCVNKTVEQSSQGIKPTTSSRDRADEIYCLDYDNRNVINLSDSSENVHKSISVDLNYEAFLANFREDGDSYVLQISDGKGKSINVKYEGDGKSSGAGLRGAKANKSKVMRESVKRKTGTRNSVTFSKTELPKDDKTVSRRGKTEGLIHSSSVPRAKVSETPRSKGNVFLGGKKPVDDIDVDYSCRTFLDNLKEDRDSYVVQFNAGEGMPRNINYEGTGDGSRGVKANKSRVTRENTEGKKGPEIPLRSSKIEINKDDKTVSKRRKIEGVTYVGKVPGSGVKVSETPRNKRKVSQREKRPSMVKKYVEPKGDGFLSVERNRLQNNCDVVDRSYKEYLSILQNGGEDFEFTPISSHQVRLEKDSQLQRDCEIIKVTSVSSPELRCKQETEYSSDSDGIRVIDDHPFSDGDDGPFVPSKAYEWIDDETTQRSERGRGIKNAWFRGKLMEILRKPYDEEEYSALYRDATVRKRQTRERELRDGRIISYEIDHLSKSYLDIYPDLKEKIILCKGEHRKILNLLRGFFLYLKNLVHPGAVFMPWADQDCLKIMMR